MEKLQQALQKARAQRGSAEQQTTAPEPTEAPDIWRELTPYEPQKKALLRNHIVAYDGSHDATPFDILRTKILLLMRKNGWRRLAITSPTEACGKTTVACNLALGLSRQPDTRAILYDLDLRNPSVSNLLAAQPPHDVTAMLSGQVSFAEQALRARDNVAIAMASERASNPARYMLSNETQSQLQKVEDAYAPDLTIFDLPPLLVGDDTRAFLSNVDCALLIARAEKTTVSQIDFSEREIAENTNVLGVVLNQCHHIDENSVYGYGDG